MNVYTFYQHQIFCSALSLYVPKYMFCEREVDVGIRTRNVFFSRFCLSKKKTKTSPWLALREKERPGRGCIYACKPIFRFRQLSPK